jgi:hypothetical protein
LDPLFYARQHDLNDAQLQTRHKARPTSQPYIGRRWRPTGFQREKITGVALLPPAAYGFFPPIPGTLFTSLDSFREHDGYPHSAGVVMQHRVVQGVDTLETFGKPDSRWAGLSFCSRPISVGGRRFRPAASIASTSAYL